MHSNIIDQANKKSPIVELMSRTIATSYLLVVYVKCFKIVIQCVSDDDRSERSEKEWMEIIRIRRRIIL